MNIKSILAISLATILSLYFVSCNKSSEAAKPVIALTEVGHENSKMAMRGDDMHLEAGIIAEGIIKAIYVEIHQESGSYEIEKEYTSGKYIGVKNTEFHEHIDIPADAPLGEYHLHFTVTDEEGGQTTAETHVDIIEYDASLIDDDEE